VPQGSLPLVAEGTLWGAHLRNSRNALADGAVKAVRQSND
jgi:hypothetical protein